MAGSESDAVRSQKTAKADARTPRTFQLRAVPYVGLRSDDPELAGLTFTGETLEEAVICAKRSIFNHLGHKHHPIEVEVNS